MSCEHVTTTNVVVAKAQSADGRSIALLVERHYKAARISDGFFLLIVAGDNDVDKAIQDADIASASVLIATSAANVHIRWESNELLVVECDSCGLKPIDISKKLDQLGSIRIIYRGFPDHTAYS